MNRSRLPAALALASVFVTASVSAQPQEPFAPKGGYLHAIHRFFPDLDSRLNAVRYGRWRALEIAWVSGINARLDAQYSAYLLALLANPPRFAPEADRVAPRFAREAVPLFLALRWGQVLEEQVLDILASPDATARLSTQRLERLHGLYRRERWGLSDPSAEGLAGDAMGSAPVSARILLAGTGLFALAAEDLAAADFGQQRWRVRKTISDFDASLTVVRDPEDATYRVAARTVTARYPAVADDLDRLARFRADVFGALVAGAETRESQLRRDERAREVARRWGLPSKGIGGR